MMLLENTVVAFRESGKVTVPGTGQSTYLKALPTCLIKRWKRCVMTYLQEDTSEAEVASGIINYSRIPVSPRPQIKRQNDSSWN